MKGSGLDNARLSLTISTISTFTALAGVAIGHLLSRSWQRKQWMLDSRKQEARDLLTAVAEHHNAILRYGSRRNMISSGEEQREAIRSIEDAQSNAIRTIRDRIVIAEDVRNADILKRWIDAFTMYKATYNPGPLTREYEAISEAIIDAAMKGIDTKRKRKRDRSGP